MICPESAKVASKKDQFVKWFKGKVGAKTQQEDVLIPEPHTMRQICMEMFLIPSKKIFVTGNFYEAYDIVNATNGLLNLYDHCYNQKVIPQGRQYYDITVTIESLKEVSVYKIIILCYDKHCV